MIGLEKMMIWMEKMMIRMEKMMMNSIDVVYDNNVSYTFFTGGGVDAQPHIRSTHKNEGIQEYVRLFTTNCGE